MIRAGEYEVFFLGVGEEEEARLSAPLRLEGEDRIVEPSPLL